MAITLDGDNLTTVGVINSKTAVASTSGTSIDFTGIPSGVKRITVMFYGVSLSGSSHVLVQIGAGSVTSSGYVGAGTYTNTTANNSSGVTSTAGVPVYIGLAAATISGTMLIVNQTGNNWVFSGTGYQSQGFTTTSSGSIALGGTLDRIRITTVNGTDTFDAGSINILYE